MFSALIESDSGERVGVPCASKQSSTITMTFLVDLAVACSGSADYEIRDFFAHIEAAAGKPVCEVCKPIIDAFYTGDWDFADDEYSFFLKRAPGLQIPEDEFRKVVQQVREKWTDVNAVIQCLEMLLPALAAPAVRKLRLYERVDLLPDLESLLDTLKFVQKRGAHRIRIRLY